MTSQLDRRVIFDGIADVDSSPSPWYNILIALDGLNKSLRRVLERSYKEYHNDLMEEFCTQQPLDHLLNLMEKAHWKRNINIKNSNPSRWFTDPWEVMRCFSDGNTNSKSIDEVTCGDMLDITINNKYFTNKLGLPRKALKQVHTSFNFDLYK